MRTRCKFHCVGVEDTEHKVGQVRVYIEQSEYDSLLDGDRGIEYQNRNLGSPQRYYRYQWDGKYAQNVRLVAQYDTTNHEDVSFAESTPSGELKIYVSNANVIGSFKPGKDYYLDLIPC